MRSKGRPLLVLGIAAQPRELAFRVLACRHDRAPPRLRPVEFAIEVCPKLSVAHRTHRRQVRLQVAARAESLHFGHEPRLDQRIEASFNSHREIAPLLGQERDGRHPRAFLCRRGMLQLG
jgi:hypothetical protein